MKNNEKSAKIQEKSNDRYDKKAAVDAVETIRKVLKDAGVSLSKEFAKCR